MPGPNLFTGPLFARLFDRARKALPALSATEREALAAGDVWWDAELFSGDPDWNRMASLAPPRLSEEERAFLDGPVQQLCAMVDDWRVSEEGDLSQEAWAFLKRHKFFGMIIPKDYGGLGFSAYAHSEVVKRVSTRSITAGVTVMVPNSLGPGELLLRFGTDAQKRHYLPRLADGREIPCFALTSEDAGSDAAAMRDRGVVCEGMHEGRRVLGLRVTWAKRYITLAPVATLLGLAFKAHDPDHLLGEQEDLGITLALIPMHTPGVEVGRRHLPAMQAFQNGPTSGADVFVPLDWVIGGRERIGQGWPMLMSALAAGRGISLPSLSAACACLAAATTGAYAFIREQFGVPIGRFEGVRERLARIAGLAYELDAVRRFTCSGLAEGHEPAIVSAIVKAHATWRMRVAVNDAMDVHGGKAIMDGPLNYLANSYRALPIAITVEGANLLTRSLIIFGQGAVRCHPHLLEEMLALQDPDERAGRERFAHAAALHLRHVVATFGRALLRSWSAGLIGPAPRARNAAQTRYYRRLARHCATLALAGEVALLALGGSLKRRESLSARLGDMLSELYFASAVVKRFDDDGRPDDDFVLVQWCCACSLARIEAALDGFIRNFPSRPLAALLRMVSLPWGVREHGPTDAVIHACAELLMQRGDSRERIIGGVFRGCARDGIERVERAFVLAHDAAPLMRKVSDAGHGDDWDAAVAAGVLTRGEAAQVREASDAVRAAIRVDDFAADELFQRRAEREPRPRSARRA
ncbi:MAG TPA: acyl-CoA dehydrogenase [Burkholderiaceae bacterium]|nr:acyl-CoA dehydrogenase [Burkholderiaceae bacterium]